MVVMSENNIRLKIIIIIIITYFSIALISSSIGTCSMRRIKGNVFNKT